MEDDTRNRRHRNHEGGPVIINKRRSPVSALFWATGATVMTCVVCASVVGIVCVSLADDLVHSSYSWLGNMSDKWPDWQRALPPVLGDAVNDVRSYEYGKLLTVDTRIVASKDGRLGNDRVVVDVKNDGDKTVSFLGLRVVIKDQDGDPAWEEITYAATPLAMDDDWRGPLLPEQTRSFSVPVRTHIPIRSATVKAEIVELRVWSGPVEREARSTRVPDEVLSAGEAVARIDEDEIHIPGRITVEEDEIDIPGRVKIKGDEIDVIGQVKVGPDKIEIPGRITIGPDVIEVPGKFTIKDGYIEFNDGRRFPAQR
jgi:hypothetical protein